MKESYLKIFFLLSFCLNAHGNQNDHAKNMTMSKELFRNEIKTLFDSQCLKCHGGDKTKSSFDLSSREGLIAGGDQGIAVIPGNAKESPLINYLRHSEEPFMPPKEDKMQESSIKLIEKWIDLGAAYDSPLVERSNGEKAPMKVTDEDRSYWAYSPIKTSFGNKNNLDDFIKSKEVATPRVLGRRLHFDLIGLPPDPDNLDDFVNNYSSKNYKAIIDSLLSNPKFGEKWARHWLDVARFGESHGFEQDYDRKFAFYYRDFVIRSFNSDMPYNEFTKWQIAGDELAPDDPMAMMATGFLGAGVYPTQITISEAERIRYDAMDDMLGTMGTAMLATTIACARCHDHKYDPIPTADYYNMLSAFTTTVRSDVDIDLASMNPKDNESLRKKVNDVRSKLKNYETNDLKKSFEKWHSNQKKDNLITKAKSPWSILVPEQIKSKGGAKFLKQDDGSYLVTGNNANFDTYTFTAKNSLEKISAILIEALKDDSMVKGGPGRASNGNIALSDFKITADGKTLKLINPRATFEQTNLPISAAIDDNPKSAWALDPKFGKDHSAMFDISSDSNSKKGDQLEIKLHFNNNHKHNIGRFRISVTDKEASTLSIKNLNSGPEKIVKEIQDAITSNSGKFDKSNIEKILTLYKTLDGHWNKLTAELKELESKQKKEIAKVMICSSGNKVKPMRHHTSSGSIPDFYKQTYFLNRGDVRQKGEVASLGFLQVLSKGTEIKSTGRTAIAEWITDVNNGAGHLLARVIVNRIWQHYFGIGIVSTPNDFGFQGEKPNHPELLDWLALELIENGWSLKHIHRLILESKAYQSPREPRRLEAEAIRDNALVVSGLLDETMYGPGTLKESMNRRSIYFFIKRSKLVPIMQLFDWPDSLSSMGKRSVTTTPSQALSFINDPNIRRMAVAFAARLKNSVDPVSLGYRIAFGRKPTKIELQTGIDFLKAQTDSYSGNKEKALTNYCGALMSSNEFIYIE